MRRSPVFLSLALAALAACGGGASSSGTTSIPTTSPAVADNSLAATLDVDVAATGTPVNTLLLGSNTQWTDNGDGLVDGNGQPAAGVTGKAQQMMPAVLRYPGGALADTYRWRDGIGPVGSRGLARDLANRNRPIVFGTDEFLQTASSLGATPMFTVNLATGTASEAADWVRYVNGAGTLRVPFWEIGNEPYLKEDARPDLAMTPEQYVARADAAIAQMKAADPRILVGLPLRSDSIGGVAATAYPGYNRTVLSGVTSKVDFVSLHNAYFPFAYTDAEVSDNDLYLAAMAATDTLAADLDATNAEMRTHRSWNVAPIAMTEYNAIFGLKSERMMQYSSSLAGALYVADTLRLLAGRNDVVNADFWSLSGNGSFGALDQDGNPRPAFYVLYAWRRLLQGQTLPAQVTSPSFSNPQVGNVPAGNVNPLVTATVTRSDKTLRIALLNKSSDRAVNLTLKLANGRSVAGTTFLRLNGSDLFAGSAGRAAVEWNENGSVNASGANMTVALPAHSFTLYEIPLE